MHYSPAELWASCPVATPTGLRSAFAREFSSIKSAKSIPFISPYLQRCPIILRPVQSSPAIVQSTAHMQTPIPRACIFFLMSEILSYASAQLPHMPRRPASIGFGRPLPPFSALACFLSPSGLRLHAVFLAKKSPWAVARKATFHAAIAPYSANLIL
ncbi:hypothetical protein BV25DRAFT_1283576 [Artomyces pyxidatus]|uniref:Uncharacterized protein n=1 Tax=Artomyces pyxidatus TaxID=48021 RepID=A0ACB8SPN9_9AGAM|nr:hypothetical protein BV25DRAFT_1283576 [Artomyces pyxidatus]